MDLIYQNGPYQIWAVQEGTSVVFYVYGVTASGDPRVCPSIGMARELCA